MPSALVTEIRKALDILAASRRLANDTCERVWDEVAGFARALPPDEAIALIHEAVGKNKKRARECVYLLIEQPDSPELRGVLKSMLEAGDTETKTAIVQWIGSRAMREFADLLVPLLNPNTDLNLLECAIHAAGSLSEPVTLGPLLKLATYDTDDLRGKLAFALKNFPTDETRSFLDRWFADSSLDSEVRVIAAWGLARMNDTAAHAFLVGALDDPDVYHARGFTPGCSLRAAQALCDLHGWPFQWSKAAVPTVKCRIAESR